MGVPQKFDIRTYPPLVTWLYNKILKRATGKSRREEIRDKIDGRTLSCHALEQIVVSTYKKTYFDEQAQPKNGDPGPTLPSSALPPSPNQKGVETPWAFPLNAYPQYTQQQNYPTPVHPSLTGLPNSYGIGWDPRQQNQYPSYPYNSLVSPDNAAFFQHKGHWKGRESMQKDKAREILGKQRVFPKAVTVRSPEETNREQPKGGAQGWWKVEVR
uniref:Uncharacterized protein n=1 Tax=Chromera velia CCMP2878 TaxID=1169474 RepID=A0A0G4IEI7_9ALVE|eukprot:Cvel_2403.t1-p1 / transcript=Cvel_2403.t1 / gene=Cvel_2403 / organism=Chromera_velia_CCMP2878 / gene_product=hypothetical protein / transcript_product=hypothetical protein / location=Cvel_scaffold93:138692-139330(+) / protein_length=213 / sequence_SO=supercontig / SO=protein_coding / is_pseudo=false